MAMSTLVSMHSRSHVDGRSHFRKNERRSSGSRTATIEPAIIPWAAVTIATGTVKRIGN
jgi:hypothetical protein